MILPVAGVSAAAAARLGAIVAIKSNTSA